MLLESDMRLIITLLLVSPLLLLAACDKTSAPQEQEETETSETVEAAPSNAARDDIALESLMLGVTGWISGLTNVFPQESVAIYRLAQQGRYQEALEIWRWFLPLLRLDTIPTLVQCIKFAEQLAGRGTERTRAPRAR